MDWIGWLGIASSVFEEEITEHFPELSLSPAKTNRNRNYVVVVDLCGSLPVWSITAFWIPVRRHYTQYECTATLKLQTLLQGLISTKSSFLQLSRLPDTQQLSKTWMNWSVKFCLAHPIYLHFFKHLNNIFAGKPLPQPIEWIKCSPGVHWLQNIGVCITEVNISHWQ